MHQVGSLGSTARSWPMRCYLKKKNNFWKRAPHHHWRERHAQNCFRYFFCDMTATLSSPFSVMDLISFPPQTALNPHPTGFKINEKNYHSSQNLPNIAIDSLICLHCQWYFLIAEILTVKLVCLQLQPGISSETRQKETSTWEVKADIDSDVFSDLFWMKSWRPFSVVERDKQKSHLAIPV